MAGRLDMIDLRGQSGFSAYPDQFVQGFEQPIPFAAHVRDVFALIFGRDFAQLDQLIGLGIKSRRINERGADAERSGLHFLADKFAHLVELLRRRWLVFKTDDVFANRRRPDK
jgi:hypothetical protein